MELKFSEPKLNQDNLITTWNKVKKLLREASSQLIVKMEEHEEFEEFLLHNELELAWDALAVIGKKQKDSLFWEKMKLAALEMGLQKMR